MRERRSLGSDAPALFGGSRPLHPWRRAQLFEPRSCLRQLILGFGIATLRDETLAELAPRHRQPERALQPREGVDCGDELRDRALVVTERSRQASLPAQHVRVD